MINVRLEGQRDVIESWLRWDASILHALQGLVRHHTTDMQGRAKTKCPVDEGTLRNSIDTVYSDDGLTGDVMTAVEYAPYVEFGTGLFAASGGGRKTQWVYFSAKLGRFVTTSGQPPQPFLLPAYNEVAPRFERDLQELLREETK